MIFIANSDNYYSSILVTRSRLLNHCRLHLVEGVGRISLAEVSLIEDPSDDERIDEGEY